VTLDVLGPPEGSVHNTLEVRVKRWRALARLRGAVRGAALRKRLAQSLPSAGNPAEPGNADG
jgi:hypothetical protein